MTAGLIVECIVILLMAATCGYCVLLNRRLHALKSGQQSLQSSIAQFDQATRQAQDNLREMERLGLSNSRDLTSASRRAQSLASELSVMISAGDKIANRIEDAVGEVRVLGGLDKSRSRAAGRDKAAA